MNPSLTGELLRPLVDTQTQTACRDCGKPMLPGDLNIITEPVHDDCASVTGFTVSLLCDMCHRPVSNFPKQRRHLHSV